MTSYAWQTESWALDAPARFSPDRVYRYRLERVVAPFATGRVCFIMLNPSTADETQDDPTIRRCMDYTKRWGYRRLVVVNLFAYRATDPRVLRKVPDPSGPENDHEIVEAAQAAELVVGAWGAHGGWRNTGRNVTALLRSRGVTVKALGLTKGGEPVHPLYQRADLTAEVLL